MCLIIPKSKNKIYTPAVFNNKPFVPAKKQLEKFIRIQKNPKVVFKFFSIFKEEGKTEIHTPFRGNPVKMNGDLLTCNGFFSVAFTSSWTLSINRGIHAYINKGIAHKNYFYNHDILLPCIIPANTPFVYGTYGEIASIQLFIPPVTKDLLPKKFHHLIK